MAGEPVDFLGIISVGAAFVCVDLQNLKDVKIGDMIGHMHFSELQDSDTHATSIIATMDGVLSLVALSDLRQEQKKSPDAFFKLSKMVANYSMQTFFHNLTGQAHNNQVKY